MLIWDKQNPFPPQHLFKTWKILARLVKQVRAFFAITNLKLSVTK